MKKIAFISSGFTGSILPLANELLKQNFQVDLYLVVFKTQNQVEHEALRLESGNYGYGIHDISNENLKGIEWLHSLCNFRFHLVCNYGNGSNKISSFVSKILQRQVNIGLIGKIKKGVFDYINVVGHDSFCVEISLHLKGYKILHTFHEVYNHSSSNKEILPAVQKIINSEIPITVPSNHLRQHLLNSSNYRRAFTLRMGLFVGYKSFQGNDHSITLPSSYLLFLGNILPYKGLDLLHQAYLALKKEKKEIKIVIAGGGNSELLNELDNNPDFFILNRWILNEELADLVQNSNGIVCPYHSASQSGLPLVAYVFGKPVVATNVGAMNEYIVDGETGFVVEPENVNALAKALDQIYNFPMTIEPATIDSCVPTWKQISDEFIKIYNTQYKNNDF